MPHDCGAFLFRYSNVVIYSQNYNTLKTANVLNFNILNKKVMENLVKEQKKTITIDRTFDLPLNTMWKAWTEEESFKKWFSPETYTTPSATIDFRVGGTYFFSMKAPDGKETWSTGTYKEIIPMKKIVYSDSFADAEGNIVNASYYNMPGDWDLALTVTVEFEETDGKTNMKLTHEGLPLEVAEDCKKGWQSCFDKLERAFKST